MRRLQGRVRPYAWGAHDAIPGLFGYPPAPEPVAEVWLGAHPDDPAVVGCDEHAPLFDLNQVYQGEYPVRPSAAEQSLADYIAADPCATLGPSVAEVSEGLPYLLKLIAPAEPLSLQVHPSREQARAGFATEEKAGIPRQAPQRNYKDTNHKPELTYALTRFDALSGFRAPRRIGTVIRGLETPLSNRLLQIIHDAGVRAAFTFLLSPDTAPTAEEVTAVAAACARRAPEESPSPRADAIVTRLAQKYPGDPGVVASLLLNPVTLRPGEALFIPNGTVHAYLSGLAVEIMATSDNVLRAGLTHKHVDAAELLRVVDAVAAPPIRIAPERVSRIMSTFYAPVEDFQLSAIHLWDANAREPIRSEGPRTVICLEGAAQLEAGGQRADVNAGQAMFIPADDGQLTMRGFGNLVLASVP